MNQFIISYHAINSLLSIIFKLSIYKTQTLNLDML